MLVTSVYAMTNSSKSQPSRHQNCPIWQAREDRFLLTGFSRPGQGNLHGWSASGFHSGNDAIPQKTYRYYLQMTYSSVLPPFSKSTGISSFSSRIIPSSEFSVITPYIFARIRCWKFALMGALRFEGGRFISIWKMNLLPKFVGWLGWAVHRFLFASMWNVTSRGLWNSYWMEINSMSPPCWFELIYPFQLLTHFIALTPHRSNLVTNNTHMTTFRSLLLHKEINDRREDILDNRELYLLRSFPNVTVSHHMAFYTDDCVRTVARNAIMGCTYFAEGKENPWEVK